jgi:class 3 adenylate cyclase
VPTLDSRQRAHLPDSAFAYIDSAGRRRLPIHDESHVRNALARFDQTAFADDASREQARARLLRAAKRHGIVPLGFFDRQLREARAQDDGPLPRGVVTLLFTDIDGSTALLRRLGDRYAGVLRNVRSVIRSSVRRADGHEVDARADEFFAVFKPPVRALEAAVRIQGALRERDWPDGVEVCVRIGIHVGRPTLLDRGYVGIAVHTAARICSAGHGGQILVSSAARETFAGDIGGVTFRALGRYSLAGLTEPQALLQADVAGGVRRFPALRVKRYRAGARA